MYICTKEIMVNVALSFVNYQVTPNDPNVQQLPASVTMSISVNTKTELMSTIAMMQIFIETLH